MKTVAVNSKPRAKPASKPDSTRVATVKVVAAKRTKPASKSDRLRARKIEALKPPRIYTKDARQKAFTAGVKILHLSPAEAIDRARLIPADEVRRFRMVRVHG